MSQSALGLIVPAVVIPLLGALAYNIGTPYEPQWIAALIGVGGILLAVHWKRRGNRFGAAMNVLMAKHTFHQLAPDEKSRVLNKTQNILERDWRYEKQDAVERLRKMNERERYGFYALSMAELGIEPSFRKERWSYVKNPFIAMISGERYIRIARNRLKDGYGKEVTLE